MSQQSKRELKLALVVGLLAGPCYLLAGPANFFGLYAVVIGGALVSTAFWFHEGPVGKLAWLLWVPVAVAGMIPSLGLAVLAGRL